VLNVSVTVTVSVAVSAASARSLLLHCDVIRVCSGELNDDDDDDDDDSSAPRSIACSRYS